MSNFKYFGLIFAAASWIVITSGFSYSAPISPDSVSSSGLVVYGEDRLIDHDTTRDVFVSFSDGGFFEFGFDQVYQSSFIRLFNDYGKNDDSLIRFSLDFYLDDTLVSQEVDLIYRPLR